MRSLIHDGANAACLSSQPIVGTRSLQLGSEPLTMSTGSAANIWRGSRG
jgi:hypothetical protein